MTDDGEERGFLSVNTHKLPICQARVSVCVCVLAVGGALSRGTAVGKPVASVLIGHRCQTGADTDRTVCSTVVSLSRCVDDSLAPVSNNKICCEQSDNLLNKG